MVIAAGGETLAGEVAVIVLGAQQGVLSDKTNFRPKWGMASQISAAHAI